ncbi:alkaline ceramidase TOD1 [Aristolochia californica]|uniref:alkaline ceramidase TOD1 n=1 Tax=Aristolochia californica TaxID=171875 RepID=UPI0035D667A6
MTAPLRSQTKLLCFSLLYLFISLFLALYTSLTATKCIIHTHSLDSISKPLFSYPKGYGQHKYAIPTIHSSCDSPLRFSDYEVVVEEINELCRNSSHFSSALRYNEDTADTFAGNFSYQKRKSYFHLSDDEKEIPCGFMKNFPISETDRMAMEKCNEVVVVSAVFGDHDKIRQPRGVGGRTPEIVCFFMFIDNFTLQGLNSHNILSNTTTENRLGVWRVVQILGDLPYRNPAMNGVIPKHLIHRLFPNSKFSIWLDAKLELTADPLVLIHSLLLKDKSDMAISKHPFNVHTMEEAIATVRWKKWDDVSSLRMQMETYCENGLEPWSTNKLPYTSDVPDTALILRKHGVASNLFSCLLFNELEAFNPRDQLAFAYVRDFMKPRLKIHMFEAEVFEHVAMEYRHNLKRNGKASPSSFPSSSKERLLKTKWVTSEAVEVSKCGEYLSRMWGESHD